MGPCSGAAVTNGAFKNGIGHTAVSDVAGAGQLGGGQSGAGKGGKFAPELHFLCYAKLLQSNTIEK